MFAGSESHARIEFDYRQFFPFRLHENARAYKLSLEMPTVSGHPIVVRDVGDGNIRLRPDDLQRFLKFALHDSAGLRLAGHAFRERFFIEINDNVG